MNTKKHLTPFLKMGSVLFGIQFHAYQFLYLNCKYVCTVFSYRPYFSLSEPNIMLKQGGGQQILSQVSLILF